MSSTICPLVSSQNRPALANVKRVMAMELHAKAQAEGDRPLAWDKLTDWGRRRYLTAAKKKIGQEKKKAAIAE
ncbi:hypothetical protein QC764_203725 [Podospora pseudoanserina]|uniref:Uncharacterized protein n=1 Tax=Podospora pseudoanserina TaxID=2609844 RepID=A0ABR0IH18_9PEZI|nr:hypothetical protein QC764_203725 [Podospora pseudoanserina]